MIKMQTFLCDGDQQIRRFGNPDLRLHRVLAGAKEDLDAQVLIDPFEEQLHLPALALKIADQLRLQGKVVGQKHQPFSADILDHDPTHCCGVILARLMSCQHTSLIAQHRSAHPIHQIKRAGLQHQIVHHIDLVRLAIGNVYETGDIASQVQQGLQLDGRLGRAKRCPGKHRQAQVDGAGVEHVDRSFEFQPKRLLGVQGARQANQVLGEVRIDLPWACGIRVGQRVARNRLTAKPHVIQPPNLGAQINLDIAQRLAVGQMAKGHGEKLIQAREVLDLVFAPMVSHTATKRAQRQIEHELRKYELALVHSGFGRKPAKNHKSDARRSNRDQTASLN